MQVSGIHIPGRHRVIDAKDLKVGQTTSREGKVCETLTRARKLQKIGQAIVRMADNVVISIR